jgi:hypothetical protein
VWAEEAIMLISNHEKLLNKIQENHHLNVHTSDTFLCSIARIKLYNEKAYIMRSSSVPQSKLWDSTLKYATPTSFSIHHAIQRMTRGELVADKVVSNK